MKIKIANYKCFGVEPQGFDDIKKINLIIGKNDSGKSSLCDIIEFLCRNNSNNMSQENKLIITDKLSSESYIKTNVNFGLPQGKNKKLREYFKEIDGIEFAYSYRRNGDSEFLKLESTDENLIYFTKTNISLLKKPLDGYNVFKIKAERDLVPNMEKNDKANIEKDGRGIISLLAGLIVSHNKHTNKALDKFLASLNSILNPEINFREIKVSMDESNYWDISFRNDNLDWNTISELGTGIKTVIHILVILNLLPNLSRMNLDNSVFIFEELENNLHPAMQRKLFNYLTEIAKKHNTYFFITTHSNIPVDLFWNCEIAQIVRVTRESGISTVTNVNSYRDHQNLLDELGYKASDLIQSNGIIWVEGPSDRTYLLKWLSIMNPDLREGVHFSIMFYGGKLLAGISFSDFVTDNLVPMLRINRNAYVVMDSDILVNSSNINTINATKERILTELGKDKCWITEGKEIENYLSKRLLFTWLQKEEQPKSIDNIINCKFDEFLASLTSVNYSSKKSKYSMEIAELISGSDLDIGDLRAKLQELVDRINSWNN